MLNKKLDELRDNMFLIYLFAFAAHCSMFLVFLLNGITLMAYFNIVSMLLYITVLVITYRESSLKVQEVIAAICTIEVVAHQVLAIICVGADIGFQYFMIMVGIITMLQRNEIIKKRVKIISFVLVIIMTVFVEVYAYFNKPLYILPEKVRPILLAVITLTAICGIFAFTLKQWNLSEHYRIQIEKLLGERNSKILNMQEKIIRNFADIVEKRDGNTGGHIKRTSAYVEAIIDALLESGEYSDILTPEYSQMVISAAPLHDIGKISISDSILCKRGKLTEEEYNIMKTHASVGGTMLQELLGNLESEEYINLATDISKYHHEKWNGKGYPEGRKGTDTPLAARIMAVADVFDALTSVRVYKDKYSLERAYEIMDEESGQQFDPVIIKEFIRIKPRIYEIYNTINE